MKIFKSLSSRSRIPSLMNRDAFLQNYYRYIGRRRVVDEMITFCLALLMQNVVISTMRINSK